MPGRHLHPRRESLFFVESKLVHPVNSYAIVSACECPLLYTNSVIDSAHHAEQKSYCPPLLARRRSSLDSGRWPQSHAPFDGERLTVACHHRGRELQRK